MDSAAKDYSVQDLLELYNPAHVDWDPRIPVGSRDKKKEELTKAMEARLTEQGELVMALMDLLTQLGMSPCRVGTENVVFPRTDYNQSSVGVAITQQGNGKYVRFVVSNIPEYHVFETNSD